MMMTDRPILFSAPMIRARLDGRKTQTRRVLKPPYGTLEYMPDRTWRPICTKFFKGDRLWVKEAWRARLYNQAVPPRDIDPWATRLHFDADGTPPECDDGTNWDRLRASIHMPRWMSRLTLTVTDVRVQRLQDISEADAMAEGADPSKREWAGVEEFGLSSDPFRYRKGFRDLWNSLHGPDAWDANPWVCALTFTVHPRNIDQIEATK
jgi:hypothetical protein